METSQDVIEQLENRVKNLMSRNITLEANKIAALKKVEVAEEKLAAMSCLALGYLAGREKATDFIRSFYFDAKDLVQGGIESVETGDNNACASSLEDQILQFHENPEFAEDNAATMAAINYLRRLADKNGDDEDAEDCDCADGGPDFEEGVCVDCGRSLEEGDEEEDGWDEPDDDDEQDVGSDTSLPAEAVEPRADAVNEKRKIAKELEEVRDTLADAVRFVADTLVTSCGITGAADLAYDTLRQSFNRGDPWARISFLGALVDECLSRRLPPEAETEGGYDWDKKTGDDKECPTPPESLKVRLDARDIIKQVAENLAEPLGGHICWDREDGG